MKESLKWQLLLVFLLAIVAGYIAYPSETKPLFGEGGMFYGRKIELGLDLQGGSELILGFKDESKLTAIEIKSGIESARNTIDRRINNLGLKEPRIQHYGETQLQIQLPGVAETEVDRIKNIITTSGKLEFRLEASKSYYDAYKERRPSAPAGYQWYEKTASDRELSEWLLLQTTPVISGTNIADAGYKTNLEEGIVVTLKLDRASSFVFAEVTGKYNENSGDSRRLAILLDGKIVSAPSIRNKITGGEAIITSGRKGGFPEEEARDLSMVLRSGSLPAPLEIRSENTVGPSLGVDAINRGMTAFIFAIIVVALFMIIYYHVAGFIAVIALIMNGLLLLGILSFFNATLTLPGIAGIVLTMGMAVDSNIIFYERIREEQEKGRAVNLAFEGGFAKALITVVDANVTTLIAGLILWYFGTGSVRGFAVTLSCGILTTLFTGYFATKLMIEFCIESGLIKKFTMFRLLSKPNFNFIKKSKPFITASVIIILIGLVMFYLRGIQSSRCYGVDFTGGTVLNIRFKEPVDIGIVRTGIQSITTTNKAGITLPKYPDVEVQSVIIPVTTTGVSEIKTLMAKVSSKAEEFQIRSGYVRTEESLQELKSDLRKLFYDKLPKEPIPISELITKGGYRVRMVLDLEMPTELQSLKTKLKDIAQRYKKEEPMVIVPSAPENITNTVSTNFEVYFREDEPTQWERILRSPDGLGLPRGIFPLAGTVGSMMAKSLQQNAVISIILSWIAMIIYIAFRFEMKYGIAAVIALVHDVLIALGATVAFNWFIPDTWGISIEVNFASVAAFMTIIGYSVNDTIVIFDRIRENTREMKGQPIEAIINASVNQTLSRTIITSLTVFFSVVILFLVTARSGGGIASFAFPMVIGTIAGSYSTIFIASPFVALWSGKKNRKV